MLAAPKPEDALDEFLSDPLLAVACVLLVVASIGWIVVSRLIVRNVKKADRYARRPPEDSLQSPRDIWSAPP